MCIIIIVIIIIIIIFIIIYIWVQKCEFKLLDMYSIILNYLLPHAISLHITWNIWASN